MTLKSKFITKFSELFDERLSKDLRPFIIRQINSDKIRQYKEEYKTKHGREPGEEEISRFVEIMIGNDQVVLEAETRLCEIRDGIAQMIYEDFRRSVLYKIILNRAISFVIAGALASYFAIGFGSIFFDNGVPKDSPFASLVSAFPVVTTFVCLLIIIIGIVNSFSSSGQA